VDLLQWDEQTRQICIDGKTMRGVKKLSPDTESHIVSAYDPHLQFVLSMDAVPVKRNELDAIRRLLDELDVTDALITIDAIGCQHDVAEQVLEAGGDYVLQVKGNQPTLLQELEDSFPNISKGYTVNKEEGLEHGRIEHRQMKSVVLSPEMLDDSYAFKDSAGIKSIHQITRKRYDKHQGKETTEMSYYISSIEDSKRIFRAIRDHWKIENQLHYMLDVYLGEDGWSKRAGEADINMELMAKIDLFILQRLKAKLGKSIPPGAIVRIMRQPCFQKHFSCYSTLSAASFAHGIRRPHLRSLRHDLAQRLMAKPAGGSLCVFLRAPRRVVSLPTDWHDGLQPCEDDDRERHDPLQKHPSRPFRQPHLHPHVATQPTDAHAGLWRDLHHVRLRASPPP